MLCINCHQPALQTIEEDGKVFYLCTNCGHKDGRAIITEGIKFQILPDSQIKHFSVGAIIQNKEKFLVIRKRVWPYLYSIVAGHINPNETPEEALEREVKEEIGVLASKINLIVYEPNLVGDKCRKGADIHEWYLFTVEVNFDMIRNNSDEAAEILWVSKSEAEKLKFTFAADYMLRKIGILQETRGL